MKNEHFLKGYKKRLFGIVVSFSIIASANLISVSALEPIQQDFEVFTSPEIVTEVISSRNLISTLAISSVSSSPMSYIIGTTPVFNQTVNNAIQEAKETQVKEAISEIPLVPVEKVVVPELKAPTSNKVSLGEYKLTFYCPCSSCSGGWGSKTASGTTVKQGRTIAVDPRKIPLGSKVYIEDWGEFVAEDTGGAIKGNKLDIYRDSHSECLKFGVQYADVYLLK